ncbi:transposon TX1 [Tanacetum coccineum]
MRESETVRETAEQGGSRSKHNGKFSPTRATRSKNISFMFFNFPESWKMGDLWMMFRKYGTVFDIFMVQKRLKNGQQYGFVRFNNVMDIETLHKTLEAIWIQHHKLRVFKAFDRMERGGGMQNKKTNEESHRISNRNQHENQGTNEYNKNKGGFRDTRMYNEVLLNGGGEYGGHKKGNSNDGSKVERQVTEMEEWVIEVETTTKIKEIMHRSVVGEVNLVG